MRTLQMACTGGVAVALMLALAAPVVAQEAEPAPEAVPIEGAVVGDHWIDETAPACDLPDTSRRFSSAGARVLSDIGEVDYYLTHCTVFDAATGGADSTYYDAMTTFTTADGDTLAVVHLFGSSEVFVGDDGQFIGFTLEGTWEAVGGSGRFMFAAGSGSIDGAADIPGEMVINLTGGITLDAPA